MDAEVASICNKVNRLCSSCWIPLRRMWKQWHLSCVVFQQLPKIIWSKKNLLPVCLCFVFVGSTCKKRKKTKNILKWLVLLYCILLLYDRIEWVCLVDFGCRSRFHLDIVWRKYYSCLCCVLQEWLMTDKACMFRDCLKGGLNLVCLCSRLCKFKCCNIIPVLDVSIKYWR